MSPEKLPAAGMDRVRTTRIIRTSELLYKRLRLTRLKDRRPRHDPTVIATSPTHPPLPFPIVKASLTLSAVVLVAAGAVYGVLGGALQWHEQAGLSLIGAFIGLVIGLTGFVPVWLMSRGSSFGGAYGFMVSIVLRVVVGGAVVTWLYMGSGMANAEDALMWVAGWYMLVLGVETKLVSSHILAATRGTQTMLETS
jgi:hypothetical protein